MFSSAKRPLGIVFVLAAAMLWILSSYVVKHLENNDEVSPFAITYFSCATPAIMLPLTYIKRSLYGVKPAADSLSDRETFVTAALIGPILWLGQFGFHVSLDLTSLTSNTLLNSTQSAFTFVLSALFLKECVNWRKIVGVAACIAGTALFAFSDASGDNENKNPLLGDALAVVSVLFYAIFIVLSCKRLPESEKVDWLMLFGLTGALNGGTFLVIGAVARAFDIEVWEGIDSKTTMVLILTKGVMDNIAATILFTKGCLLSGPTVGMLTMTFQWPMAFLFDALFFTAAWMHHPESLIFVLIGTALISIGFIVFLKFDEPSKSSDIVQLYDPLSDSVDCTENYAI